MTRSAEYALPVDRDRAAEMAELLGEGDSGLATGFAPPLYVVRAMSEGMTAAAPWLGSMPEVEALWHVEHQIEFMRPLPLDSEVDVHAQWLDAGDYGLRFAQRIGFDLALGDGRLAASMVATLTTGPRRKGRQLPLPDPPAAATCLAAETVVGIEHDLPARFAEVSGDRNPVHVDADFARGHGLPGVIVHGMATLGMTLTAVRRLLGSDGNALRRVRVRFARPVLPGSQLRVAVHRTTRDGVHRVRATVDDVEVLKNFEVTHDHAG